MAEPRLELLAPVQLNIVCFRYRAADANKVNGDIVIDIQESGIAAPSTTILDGQLAIRAAIVNHRTDISDIDALICAVLQFGAQRERLDGFRLAYSPLAGEVGLHRRCDPGEGAIIVGRNPHPTGGEGARCRCLCGSI